MESEPDRTTRFSNKRVDAKSRYAPIDVVVFVLSEYVLRQMVVCWLPGRPFNADLLHRSIIWHTIRTRETPFGVIAEQVAARVHKSSLESCRSTRERKRDRLKIFYGHDVCVDWGCGPSHICARGRSIAYFRGRSC